MGTSLDEKTSAEVLRQVEFYFSDSNLPQDKVLCKCLEESEDGLVSLPLICSFKRMRTHLGLPDSGLDKVSDEITAAVADVLRKSTVLRISDDGHKVGRKNLISLDEKTRAEVLRQVEFYFSDSNLPRDKFLRKCLEESEDGLVSLALICSFKRMRNHLRLPDSGLDKVSEEITAAVADVLRKSTVLRISDDGQKVGRKNSLLKPEEIKAEVDARSIAAGPLRWNVTMEELNTFFSEYGKVNSVRLPRHPFGRVFCGYAVIEFMSEEEAKKVMGMKLTYDGVELEMKTRNELDIELEKQKAEQETKQPGQIKQLDMNFNFPKGLVVAFSLEKLNSNDSTAVKTEGVTTVDFKETSDTVETEGTPGKVDTEGVPDTVETKETPNAPETGGAPNALESEGASNAVEVKEGPVSSKDRDAGETKENVAATVSSRDGKAHADQIGWRDIKDLLKVYGTIKFVEYSNGQPSGFVRFEDAESAQKARAAAVLAEEGGLILKAHLVTLEAVEGEAEREYWTRFTGERGQGHRDKFRGGRNDRFGGKGRRQHDNRQTKPESKTKLGKHQRFEDDDDDVVEHASKQAKSESAAAS